MKNPYELRTEILAMAKDYLDKQYQMNMEITYKLIEMNQATIRDLPKMYGVNELLDKASELYQFVNKKGE